MNLSDDIKSARSLQDFKVIAKKIVGEFDTLFEGALERSGQKIDCRVGCWYCCYYKVDITPLEAFVVKGYIDRNFNDLEKSIIKERAAKNWGQIQGMTAAQHTLANIACPLLRDGACSVYEARPRLCRSHHSTDVSACKSGYENSCENPDFDTRVPEVKVSMAQAHMQVSAHFKEAGYDSRPYDINAVLLELLSGSKAEKRWRDGKRAFSSASLAKDWRENVGTE